jgi:hypothetical protein
MPPWSKVLLEKRIVTQLVKKLPEFIGTRKFFIVFTTARLRTLFRAKWFQSSPVLYKHCTQVSITEILWYISRCSPVEVDGRLSPVRPDDGGSNKQFLQEYTAQHSSRRLSLYSTPWEPEVSLIVPCFTKIRSLVSVMKRAKSISPLFFHLIQRTHRMETYKPYCCWSTVLFLLVWGAELLYCLHNCLRSLGGMEVLKCWSLWLVLIMTRHFRVIMA